MTSQFLRKSQLLVANGADALDLSELRFTFDIRQADIETPQSGVIRIYNLSDTTKKSINANQYSRIILQAGYENGNFGLIFDGTGIQYLDGRDNAVDAFLEITAAEGDEFQNNTFLNHSLAGGASQTDTLKSVLTSALGQLKSDILTQGYLPALPGAALPRGQVFHGMSRNYVHAVAATNGLTYFISKGQINFVPLAGVMPGQVVRISSDTGMINWPRQTEAGIEVDVLLNPLISPGSLVQIDNASIVKASYSAVYGQAQLQSAQLPSLDDDGLYRVYVVNHKGDSRGNDYYSHLTCLSVDPSKSGLTALIERGQF